MTVSRAAGGPSLVAALAARAEAWLLEPAPTRPSGRGPGDATAPADRDPRLPVVAVIALARRAGASTVARGLAARLACLDPSGAAVLAASEVPPPPALGAHAITTRAAVELARGLGERGCEEVRSLGRLCLVCLDEPLAPIALTAEAPLVLDLSHGEPTECALAIAGHAVLVATPQVEPALVDAVSRSLRAGGHAVDLVLNRATTDTNDDSPAVRRGIPGAPVTVAESRLAAQATRACRGPRGALATPIAELAERCLAQVRP